MTSFYAPQEVTLFTGRQYAVDYHRSAARAVARRLPWVSRGWSVDTHPVDIGSHFCDLQPVERQARSVINPRSCEGMRTRRSLRLTRPA